MNILTLIHLEMINVFGINEIRYAKNPDEKKRRRFMLIVIGLLSLILVGYITGEAIGLTQLGLSDKIPMITFLIAFLFNLFFGVYKAKAFIYRERDIEQISALPISGVSVAASRLFRLYVENVVLCAGVVIPSMIVYGASTGCGPMLYIALLPVCIILPILPTVIAAWIGILFAAVISRMKHKVLAEVLLMLIVVGGTFMFSTLLTSKMNMDSFGNSNTEEVNAQITAYVIEVFNKADSLFPPLRLMGDMLKTPDFVGIIKYALLSIALLIPTVIVIGKNFFGILRRLFERNVSHEYKLEELKQKSIMTALVKKESARYFSSGLYVSNTIIGPVFAVAFAVILGFVDISKILNGVENLPFKLNVNAGIAYIIGMCYCMCTAAASSVSLEGKNWWIMKSLPVDSKDVFNAKILFSLILLAPAYFISEIIMLFTVRTGILGRMWLIVIPAITMLLSVLFGLFCNIKFPKFNWKNEVEVIKQSASVGLSLLGALIVIIAGMAAMIIPGDYNALYNMGYIILMGIISVLLYRRIINTKI